MAGDLSSLHLSTPVVGLLIVALPYSSFALPCCALPYSSSASPCCALPRRILLPSSHLLNALSCNAADQRVDKLPTPHLVRQPPGLRGAMRCLTWCVVWRSTQKNERCVLLPARSVSCVGGTSCRRDGWYGAQGHYPRVATVGLLSCRNRDLPLVSDSDHQRGLGVGLSWAGLC